MCAHTDTQTHPLPANRGDAEGQKTNITQAKKGHNKGQKIVEDGGSVIPLTRAGRGNDRRLQLQLQVPI